MSNPDWSVKRVEVILPYSLKLWFEDGSIKLYDMTPKLDYPCFRPLKEQVLFQQARAFWGTVVWTDDIDIAPEELYENSIPLQ